jgi:hypothetical protein
MGDSPLKRFLPRNGGKKYTPEKTETISRPVPGMSVDYSPHVISLVFDCDEGEDFR